MSLVKPGEPLPPVPVARAPVDINYRDVDNIVLTFAPFVSVKGRLSVDSQPPSTLPGLDSIRIALVPPRAGTANIGVIPGIHTPIQPDGTFTYPSLIPDVYRVTIGGLPPDAFVKQARHGNVDVLSNSMKISGSDSDPINVLISLKGGRIDGTVVDERGKPVANITAVLVPDKLRHRTDLYKTATTDANGHFTIRGITPGEYSVVAQTKLEPYAYFDPDFLKQFEKQSELVRISESSKAVVNVKAIVRRDLPIRLLLNHRPGYRCLLHMFPILWLALSLAGLQVRPAPRPDAAPSRASIQGVVVRAGAIAAPQQLADARVELKPGNLSVFTGADGAFTFRNLAPGRYTISVTHDGFVPQEDRRRGLTVSGLSVTLAADQTLKDIVLPMIPAPVITGNVFDPHGEPLAAALVRAYLRQYTPYGTQLKIVRTAMTNDMGEFRLFGLNFGEYFVSAGYSDRDRGTAIGRAQLSANVSKADDGYATIFYDGSEDISRAQAAHLAPGSDPGTLNIYLRTSARFKIRGQVLPMMNGANI